MPQERTEQTPNLALSVMLSAVLAVLLCAPMSAIEVVTQPVSTCNACNGEATFSPDDFTQEYDLVWSTQDGEVISSGSFIGQTSVADLCAGIYLINWSSSNDNGELYFSVGLNGPDAGQATNINLCTGSGNTNLFTRLDGTPAAGGTWTNPAGEAATGIFNPSNGMPGLYTYSVEVDGCELTSGVNVTVIQNADPGLSTTYLICEDYEPFFLTDVLAGTPDYGGQWFNGEQEPINGFYNPETDDTQLFTYMIDTVQGCPPVFSTMFVIENTLPDPGESAIIAVCPNAVPFNMTEQLGGNPNTNGVWTTNTNTPVGDVFDPQVLPQGVYTYTVQGLTPCPSQEATLTVTFTDEISAGTPSPVDLCSSTPSYNLFNALSGSVTPGGQWLDPLGNEIDPVLSPNEMIQGNYTYSINAVGCQPLISTVPVAVEDPVNAGPGGVIEVCETSSPIVLNNLYGSDATPNGAWSVNGNPISGSLIVEGGQSYELLYEVSAEICPDASALYTVNTGILPEAPVNQEVNICSSAGSINLQSLMPDPGIFETTWANPGGEQVDSVVSLMESNSGVYTYTLVSGNDCPDATTTVELSIDTPAFPSAALETEVCYGGGALDLNAISGGLPAGGEWTLEGVSVPQPLPSGQVISGSYIYTFDNGNSCEVSTFSLDLELVTPLSAGAGATLTICSTEPPFHPENYIVGASEGGSWLSFDEPVENPIFDPSLGEDGFYTYLIPAIGPCPGDSSFVEVIVDSGFAYTAGPDLSVCADEESVVLGQGACDACTYTWQPQNGLDDPDSATPTFTWGNISTSQNYSFEVTVTNGVCTIEDDITVTVHPTPSVSITGPTEVCIGSQATFVAGGAPEYSWIFPDGQISFGSSVTSWVDDDLSITLVGSNSFGCSAQTEIAIEALMPPLVATDIPPVGGCSPLEVELPTVELEEGVMAFWSLDGDQFVMGSTVLIETPGVYDLTLEVTGENGCVSLFTTDEAFDIYPSPTAWFEPEPAVVSVIDPQIHFINDSQAVTEWMWDFGGQGSSDDLSPRFTFPEVADQGYRVCLEVINAFGCRDELCREVFVKGEMALYVPNAFTPDGDGVNEVFKPFISGFVPGSYELQIFNRWGERVFVTSDPDDFWIGNVTGGNHYAQNEAYTWVIKARDAYTSEARRFEGHVLLIR